MHSVDTAIVGAGPYGLSLAAHLQARKIKYRIFGKPMWSWRDAMLPTTTLKSLGFASNLYNPGEHYTLKAFCREHEMPYSEASGSIPIGTFAAYGMEFQRRFVGELQQDDIAHLERSAHGFCLTTVQGETIQARRVVLAIGITHFDYTPPVLQGFSPERVTHSSDHNTLQHFHHRRVAVVGSGASATDMAAHLQERGHDVHLIARRHAINFQAPTTLERTLVMRIRKPRSGLGDGWRGRLCANHPLLFHKLPAGVRDSTVRRVNGPSAVWNTREKLIGKVHLHVSTAIQSATETSEQVSLRLSTPDGQSQEVGFDHVIAATGYKVSLGRLSFLCPSLQEEVRTQFGSPDLTSNFETSVPDLFMTGLASAQSFGPLLRFAFGAGFTSKRIAARLA